MNKVSDRNIQKSLSTHRLGSLSPFYETQCTTLLRHSKRRRMRIALYGKHIAQLRSVTCHMGSHSVICHPTQVNAPRLNPSQTGQYSICQPGRDGRLSWPWWLVIYRISIHITVTHRRFSFPKVIYPTDRRSNWCLLLYLDNHSGKAKVK